jgi:hypothetical protein
VSEQTPNVRRFIAANAISPVVSGAAYEQGGGRYKLEDGKSFKFTLEEVRSMPRVRWCFDGQENPA